MMHLTIKKVMKFIYDEKIRGELGTSGVQLQWWSQFPSPFIKRVWLALYTLRNSWLDFTHCWRSCMIMCLDTNLADTLTCLKVHRLQCVMWSIFVLLRILFYRHFVLVFVFILCNCLLFMCYISLQSDIQSSILHHSHFQTINKINTINVK
jgi:hypothetical protein